MSIRFSMRLFIGVAALVGLTGCDLPRPFDHTLFGPTPPGLARLQTGGGVAVFPVMGAPQPFAQAAAEGLAAALRDRDVPADVVDEPGARSYVLNTRFAFVAPPRPDLVAAEVSWDLLGPEGHSLVRYDQLIALPFAQWTDAATLREQGGIAAAALLPALQADTERPLEQRRAADAPRPLPHAASPVAQAPEPAAPPAPVVTPRTPAPAPAGVAGAQTVTVQVAGLDDARAATLRGAMEAALRRSGLDPVSDGGALTVVGTLERGTAQDTPQGRAVPVRVVWQVSRGDTGLGQAVQENPVPEALLEQAFPSLAVMIAQGGAQGVASVLAQTPAAQ